MVHRGGFNLKSGKRRATEWRLTRFTCDATGKLASKTFMNWRPKIRLDSRDQARRLQDLLRIDRSDVRAFSLGGHDWSDKYARLVETAGKLKCRSAILDGEVIVQDKNGLSDFAALRAAIEGAPYRLVMFAFDLLFLDGDDLRRLPLVERREQLGRLLPKDTRRAIQFSDHYEGQGAVLFKQACAMGLEGIVSKRALSPYKGSGPVPSSRCPPIIW